MGYHRLVAFNASKIISSLPPTLVADHVYYVRVGLGFDTYITDSTGNIAHKQNSGSSFLPVPDLIDETNTSYFYSGWESINDSWLIERQSRTTSTREFANSGYVNLTTAWENKETLEYS